MSVASPPRHIIVKSGAKPRTVDYPGWHAIEALGRVAFLRPGLVVDGSTGGDSCMAFLSRATLDRLHDDFDAREEILRQVVADRLGERPAPGLPDHVVATYYFAFRSGTLEHAVEEISYHATSGVKNPPPGSLLAQCSAQQAGVDPFDASGRIGLLHV